ncbi:MAG: multicopper oxidase domain-containing protein [Gammaproteobacteria bacterium]|nr:multicopper oxidase domain-containing protein [Gammaproteobacteria bacterium]
MLTKSKRTLHRVLDLHREIAQARLSRRELIKLGLVTGGSGLLGLGGTWLSKASALDVILPSPSTTAWVEQLPIPSVLEPSALGGPDPNPAAHQFYNRFPPQKTYRVRAEEKPHSFHRDLIDSPIWGFNGVFPGPTSESDGGPWNWTERGQYTDHHYCMARAGFTVPETIPAEWRDASGGDIRETLTTLFFHYHRPDFTSAGVYKGLASMVRFFDEKDTGDETQGWRLPSGPYDIPLMVADKKFDPRTGELVFDDFNLDGVLGDKITVNGKIQPFLEVKRRKYRFRVLNAGPARFYTFVLRRGGKYQPFTQITDNGNLLERPRKNLTKLETWPAERSDIIIDFKRFQPGDKVYLANILPMKDGRQPDRKSTLNPDRVENQLIEFRIGGEAADPSRVPDAFRPFPPIDLSEVAQRRVWNFERGNGMWQVNGKLWDSDIDHTPKQLANPPVQVKRNTAEIWVLKNLSGGWEHPLHIHFEEGRVLTTNGVAPTMAQRSRQDMYRLGRDTTTEVFLRFRDFPDPEFDPSVELGRRARYVLHCHNLTHEDHAMMATWNIVP